MSNTTETTAMKRPFSNLAADLPSSLVVFLVAVPLALGIALASGAPVTAGLIGCVVGGIVVGSLSGAPLQVTGPAAGLTVLVYGLIQKYGFPAMCAITIVAGLIQVALGFSRVARACLAISPAVVHGMLAGIGVVIVLAQLHVLLGDSPQSSAGLNLLALPREVVEVVGQPSSTRTHATLLGLFSFGALVAWSYLPKRVQMLPGALVAVLAGTILGNVLWTDAPRVKIPDGPLFTFAMPAFPSDWGGLAVAALSVALVASVESLLCAVATDKLHNGPRANMDKELVAQGAGNAVSGLLGGLPMTGVIVRSAANVTAGARTRVSAILHGVWVLLFVLLAANYLNRIPQAVLAGLLVHVGLRLINFHHIKALVTHREAVIYVVTVLGVAFWNLLYGVGLGIGLAMVLLLFRLSRVTARVEQRESRWHVRLEGALTFLSVPQMSKTLAQIPSGADVDVDIMADFMDHAAFEALHSWRLAQERTGAHVDIDELHEKWYADAASGSPQRVKTLPSGLTNSPPSPVREPAVL